jgi:hypothetical protein
LTDAVTCFVIEGGKGTALRTGAKFPCALANYIHIKHAFIILLFVMIVTNTRILAFRDVGMRRATTERRIKQFGMNFAVSAQPIFFIIFT